MGFMSPQESQGPFGQFMSPQGPFGQFMPPQGPQGPHDTQGLQGLQGPFQQFAPTSPPPAQEPQISPFAVDPRAIAGCLFRMTFIWLTNRDRFWFFPIFVGRTSVSGFRFFGGRWRYYGIDLREINSFSC